MIKGSWWIPAVWASSEFGPWNLFDGVSRRCDARESVEDLPKWKVENDQSKSRAGQHGIERSARHGPLRDDLPGYDGVISSEPLLYSPYDDRDTKDHQNEDDAPIAPGILLTTPGQRQQQADDRRHEDGGSDGIELGHYLEPCLVLEAVRVLIVDWLENEEDHDGGDGAQREVNCN